MEFLQFILKVWFELEMMVRNGGDFYFIIWGIFKFRERRKEFECQERGIFIFIRFEGVIKLVKYGSDLEEEGEVFGIWGLVSLFLSQMQVVIFVFQNLGV